MVGVTQTTEENCLQAAVATLLGLGLAEVPDFTVHKNWWDPLYAWFEGLGYEVWWSGVADAGPVEWGIAVGLSPRGIRHAVTWADGSLVWDPHPSRAGLTSVEGFFVVVRPESVSR